MSLCHYCHRTDFGYPRRRILGGSDDGTTATVSKPQLLMWVCPDCETGHGAPVALERRTRLWPIPVAGMAFLVLIAWAVAFAVH